MTATILSKSLSGSSPLGARDLLKAMEEVVEKTEKMGLTEKNQTPDSETTQHFL